MVARPTAWPSPAGELLDHLPAGHHILPNPIPILPGQTLRGHPDGTLLEAADRTRPLFEILGGTVENLELLGGSIVVNVHDGAVDVILRRVWIRDAVSIGLWLGQGSRTTIVDLVVERAGDNGIQCQAPASVDARNVVLLGPFGNKALDCTHRKPLTNRNPANVRFTHVTILDPHGYGVGLEGWRPGEGHVLANALILERSTGSGAGGYAVFCPPGPSSGTFERVVASATGQALERTFPGLVPPPDPRAFLASALPSNLIGLWPNQFELSPIPEDVGPGQRWRALTALAPVHDSPLWIASPSWGSRRDILGNRRRLHRLAFAVGALG